MWRLLTSERLSVTMSELEGWSMLDLAHAHMTLDAIEEIETRAARTAKR